MNSNTPTDERMVEALHAAFPADAFRADDRLPDALRDRLVDDADHAGLLDLAYREIDSPYGSLLLAATPDGLVRVAFELEGHDAVLDQLRIDGEPTDPPVAASHRCRGPPARRVLRPDHDTAFDVPLDLRLVAGFRREVIARLRDIAYGTTESYGEVARAVGNPAAVRAAGSACSHNPIPLVVPCHRVVRSDGSIGQYLGGSEVKQALLAMEAAA